VTFAGVLFLVGAAFNALDGIVALADPGHFFVTEEGVLIADYDAFGVVLLAIAGIELLLGWGILALQRWAQVLGIILVLNAIILYALTVYSDEFAPAGRRR
jgi:hypothetical protein